MNYPCKIIFLVFIIGCGGSDHDELTKAVEDGNFAKVKTLISRVVIVNEFSSELNKLLEIAIKVEHVDIIELLIQSGADIHANKIKDLIVANENTRIIKVFCNHGLSPACFKIENESGYDVADIELSNNLLLVAKGYSAQVGNMLYISGQIGNIEKNYNAIIEGGIRSQVNQAMINIESILNKYNATMGNLLKCTCIMSDTADKAVINKIYEEYFTRNKPARITFDEVKLESGILVEIECVAKVK